MRYVAARSGLRWIEPIAGALPPGSHSPTVEVKSENRFRFICCSLFICLPMTKPRSASWAAGSSTEARLMVPQLRSARSHSAGVPGTPTDSPELTTSSNPSALPVAGSVNESGRIAAGAVSRPSMVCTWRVLAS